MSDRGFAPDASPACPFVALEDDRDARSDRPDHRHRCFAEVRPAPRAVAHQERYCLSAGFTTCPTFLDWARREAAGVRPSSAPAMEAAAVADGAAVATAAPGATTTGPEADDPEPDDEPEVWPVRPQRRDWAAPPPWGPAAAGGAAASASSRDAAADDAEPGEPVDAPAFLTGREPAPPPPPPTPPGPSVPARAATTASSASAAASPSASSGVDGESATEQELRTFGSAAGRSRPNDKSSQPAEARRRPPSDPGAPAWERPRRFEAYPTIKIRTGLSSPSPLLIGGVLVLIAALGLFFIPPMLLGLGGGGESSPSPSPSVRPSSSVRPSPSPSPSPAQQTYVVKAGDTASAIAQQFGLTLDQLIAANPETLANPDSLQIGDELVIPSAPPDVIPGASASPSPSP